MAVLPGFTHRRQLLAGLLCALVAPVLAQSQSLERSIEVRLGAAGEMLSYEDMIDEYESVTYALTLQQGDAVRITLASSNAANCFDILAPGASKPVYSGGESGNDTTLVAKVPGTYVVRVYLLRFAARDGQSAQFTLELRRAG